MKLISIFKKGDDDFKEIMSRRLKKLENKTEQEFGD
jgi:hypothetical protein